MLKLEEAWGRAGGGGSLQDAKGSWKGSGEFQFKQRGGACGREFRAVASIRGRDLGGSRLSDREDQ